MVIRSYPLELGRQVVPLPLNSRILSASVKDGGLVLWVMQEADAVGVSGRAVWVATEGEEMPRDVINMAPIGVVDYRGQSRLVLFRR